MKRRHQESGIGIVELVVALGIFSIVLTIAYEVFFAGNRANEATFSKNKVIAEMRSFLQRSASDLQVATEIVVARPEQVVFTARMGDLSTEDNDDQQLVCARLASVGEGAAPRVLVREIGDVNVDGDCPREASGSLTKQTSTTEFSATQSDDAVFSYFALENSVSGVNDIDGAPIGWTSGGDADVTQLSDIKRVQVDVAIESTLTKRTESGRTSVWLENAA